MMQDEKQNKLFKSIDWIGLELSKLWASYSMICILQLIAFYLILKYNTSFTENINSYLESTKLYKIVMDYSYVLLQHDLLDNENLTALYSFLAKMFLFFANCLIYTAQFIFFTISALYYLRFSLLIINFLSRKISIIMPESVFKKMKFSALCFGAFWTLVNISIHIITYFNSIDIYINSIFLLYILHIFIVYFVIRFKCFGFSFIEKEYKKKLKPAMA